MCSEPKYQANSEKQHEHGPQGAGSDANANVNDTKVAELWLPYMDPEEDMHYALNDSPSGLDALTALARNMDRAGDTLRAVKDALASHDARVWTENDAILVQGPTAVIEGLLAEEHLQTWPGDEATADQEIAVEPSHPDAHCGPQANTSEADHSNPDAEASLLTKGVLDLNYSIPARDLLAVIKCTDNLSTALALHATVMDDAARSLRYFRNTLAGRDVAIGPINFGILVHGLPEVIGDLIERGALTELKQPEVAEPTVEDDTGSPFMVRCGDHQWAPGVLVCVHIAEEVASVIVPVPWGGGSDVTCDWVCMECHKRFFTDKAESEPSIDNFKFFCIHCLRDMLRPGQETRVQSNPDSVKPPQFMFMHDGSYMIHDDGEHRGIILARTREMAKQYVAHVENRMGIKVVIAKIAALTDLPLHEFLQEAIEDEGANCAFVIREIKDGKVAYVRLLPPEEHRT